VDEAFLQEPVMFEINKDRFERLRALEPIEAVEMWLANDFGLGPDSREVAVVLQRERAEE
jgi:hypothetical protein